MSMELLRFLASRDVASFGLGGNSPLNLKKKKKKHYYIYV